MNFVQRYLAGELDFDKVDDLVEFWHLTDTTWTMPLHEFLGFTWDEYAMFVRDPAECKRLLDLRKMP